MYTGQFQKYTADKAEELSITPEQLILKAHQYLVQGNNLLDERKLEESVEQYTKGIELSPLMWECIDNRGLALLDLGRYDEAESDFQLSLEVNPEGELAQRKLEWLASNNNNNTNKYCP
jgi:tetratricopeptide (TPR) repeat protein